ncbi:MAG: hydroxyisourate hydrolase [Methyloceanibacter sp.]|uniref:hydroxyisourate hydrolase n=1 Tax=Methyloceanibacter sp. TaxID=1965321 RepID=UPI003D9B8ADC
MNVKEAFAPAPAKLSTHALDMYLGRQAAGMRIDFSRKEGDTWKLLKTVTADENGRVGDELMSADTMEVGRSNSCSMSKTTTRPRCEAHRPGLSRYGARAYRHL